ncbi:MAG: DnaB-like helicase C-terminal domain-containing protein [Nitrosopumilus sp.]
MNTKRLARLVYLVGTLKDRTPRLPKALRKYIPQMEIIEACTQGANAAAADLDVDVDRLRRLFKEGKRHGEPSPEEIRTILSREVMDSDKLDDLTLRQKTRVIALVDSYLNSSDDHMVAREETSLGSIKEIPKMHRWESGFTPLDLVLGGCYQGVHTIVARPGGGKTATCLSIASCIKKTHPKWNILFFEMEIPRNLMLARMGPLIEKGYFTEEDELITGGTTIADLVEKVKERRVARPDERLVIFVDSPDTMPGISMDARRFELGFIYRQLVKIKGQEGVEALFVTSQPNRASKGPIQQRNIAESWEKVILSDSVTAIARAGFDRLQIRSLKNRFGIEGLEVLYHYDFVTLESNEAFLVDEDGEW